MNWKKCPYMEKVFMIGGQFYTAVIGQFYAALDRNRIISRYHGIFRNHGTSGRLFEAVPGF